MSNIRPESLSNEELLRYALIENTSGLSEEWARVILQRFAMLLDNIEELKANQADYDDGYADGIADGRLDA